MYKTRFENTNIIQRKLNDISKDQWDILSKKKIFFGHMSVGYNIIEGIKTIIKENDCIKLNLKETSNPADFNKPILAHSRIGENKNPESKITGFRDIMTSGIGNKIDIAFFKFCYVDIDHKTNIDLIFTQYKEQLEQMQKDYPNAEFIHVTLPICSPPKGLKKAIKTQIKSILGKKNFLDDNNQRIKYNKFIINNYKANNIFDLAFAESVKPNGQQAYIQKKKSRTFILLPEYTNDGGHLNFTGQKILAEQLLVKLAEIAINDLKTTLNRTI